MARSLPWTTMADQAGVTFGTCDSCGRGDEDVTEVVRVYVVAESWDQERQVTEAEGTERWCFPCLTHYPHRVVGDEPATDPGDQTK
jgi:hypothetical protein